MPAYDEETLRSLLARSRALEVLPGPALRVQRRRAFGTRGLFRLLIPRVVVTIEDGQAKGRPDALAWLMLVLCAGGVVVELTMDRARYPREYPPQFVFVLAGAFVAALAWEWVRAKELVARALRPPGA